MTATPAPRRSWSATVSTRWSCRKKTTTGYFSGLISYQLDHIQRPQICILPNSGKPLLLVYGNDKAKAKPLPWVGEVRAYTDVTFPQEMIAASIKEMGLGKAFACSR